MTGMVYQNIDPYSFLSYSPYYSQGGVQFPTGGMARKRRARERLRRTAKGQQIW